MKTTILQKGKDMFARKANQAAKTELPEINFDIPTINVPRPLSDKARTIVEAGFAEFASMKIERDEADAQRIKALDLVNQATTSIKSLQQEIDNLKGRCISYQLERDEAVAKFAKLEALFTAMQAQMHAFKIPSQSKKVEPVEFSGGGGGAKSTPLPPMPDIEEEMRKALSIGEKIDVKART